MSSPRPKKSLGQHWLTDQSTSDKIAALAAKEAGQSIFEIGPGAGALTRPLLNRYERVVALETDRQALAYLKEEFATEIADGRLELFEGDGRSFALPEAPDGAWTVVSNLPYNVGAIVFLNLLAQRSKIRRMVLMFQAEVATRILSGSGSKQHGFLSVLSALEWSRTRALRVKPGAFFPPPKVQSSVIVLDRDDDGPGCPAPREIFVPFVDACFRQRRKTLRNCLTHAGYSAEAIAQMFQAEGLAQTIRAEQLDAGRFRSLFLALPLTIHQQCMGLSAPSE